MKKLVAVIAFLAVVMVLLIIPRVSISAGTYGEVLCHQAGYTCFKVPRGETWATLFPNETQRNIIMRINRMIINPYPGSIIAIPENLDNTNIMDYAPFDKKISPLDKNTVIVDPKILAWGAYNQNGDLIKWGPASLGRDYCPDMGSACHTKPGTYTVYSKGGENCVSSKFPIPDGGAPMPYCMFFNRGQALHGSDEVPGFNASHGCVRMYVEDAYWLSKQFVEKGTRVIIEPYGSH